MGIGHQTQHRRSCGEIFQVNRWNGWNGRGNGNSSDPILEQSKKTSLVCYWSHGKCNTIMEISLDPLRTCACESSFSFFFPNVYKNIQNLADWRSSSLLFWTQMSIFTFTKPKKKTKEKTSPNSLNERIPHLSLQEILCKSIPFSKIGYTGKYQTSSNSAKWNLLNH